MIIIRSRAQTAGAPVETEGIIRWECCRAFSLCYSTQKFWPLFVTLLPPHFSPLTLHSSIKMFSSVRTCVFVLSTFTFPKLSKIVIIFFPVGMNGGNVQVWHKYQVFQAFSIPMSSSDKMSVQTGSISRNKHKAVCKYVSVKRKARVGVIRTV